MAMFAIFGSLRIEMLSPIYQTIGFVPSIDIPVCSCVGPYDPRDAMRPDEEIDLDASIDNSSKFGWVFLRPDRSSLVVRFSTNKQIYDFLTGSSANLCLASGGGPACMRGQIVITASPDGDFGELSYDSLPCNSATAVPHQWVTPVIDFKTCSIVTTPEFDSDNPPPQPTFDQ